MRMDFETSGDLIKKLQLGIRCMSHDYNDLKLYSEVKNVIHSIVSSQKNLQDKYDIPIECHIGNIAIIAQRLDDELTKKRTWGTFSWKEIRGSDGEQEIKVMLDSHAFPIACCTKRHRSLLELSMDRDIKCEIDDSEINSYMVGTGCGIPYCCPTLSWSVQHLGDGRTRLYNFYSRTLDGSFDKDDPRSNVIWHYHVNTTLRVDEYVKFVQKIIQ